MAARTEAERVRMWEGRVRSGTKIYESWSDEFQTPKLEEYYKGNQWRGYPEEEARKKYVINLVFSSMEVNKPSLIFDRPQVRVQARPSHSEDLGSDAEARAKLCQDTIQTFIDDPDLGFDAETQLALHEAHFRFGVVEVGYTADWIDNPNVGKPIMKDEEGKVPYTDNDGAPVTEGARVVQSEQLYVKRIPAKSFRVAVSNTNKLQRNDWIGYYEWQYVEDLKSNKNYKNTAGLKSTGILDKNLRPEGEKNLTMEVDATHGMCKVWKIWDLRARKRHVFVEGHKKFLKEDEEYKFAPFAIIKFHEILDSFYPIPPVWQWLGPQDETNETRDMQRAHRRRFYRRYTYRSGAIDEPELEKLETGGDGVYARANQDNPIQPVPDAPLSADVWRNLDESKNDFITVSSVGGEQRGVAESDTATQATIIDQRSRIRESAARMKVSRWLASIARLMLLTVRENMSLPLMVQRSTDPYAQGVQEGKTLLWQQIKSEELGEMDLDVFVDLASMSPITEEAQRNTWNQVLALISNPTICGMLSQSEVLLRKTLSMYGIKAETEIQEIKKVMQQVAAQIAQMQQMAAMGGKAPMPGGPGADAAPMPATGPQGGQPMTGDDLSKIFGAVTQGGGVS